MFYGEVNAKLGPSTDLQLGDSYATPSLFELILARRNSGVDVALEHRFWNKQGN